MKKVFFLLTCLFLPAQALKISVGGSHLVGIHHEIELSDNMIIDTSFGFFEFEEMIFAASHQFLFPLSRSNALYIGYGAFAVAVPVAEGLLVAVKLPLGWRHELNSGNRLILGIDINYLLGFTVQNTDQWSTQFNITPPIVVFPFIAYEF